MFDDHKDKQPERTYDSPPPIADEQLVLIYKIWRRRHESKYIPKDFLAAAAWWLDHQEPQGRNETPQLEHDKKGAPHWKVPFIERVAATWLTFLAFSEPQKAFVVQHIESGIPYRGDDMKFYQEVVKESAKMLEAQATPETWEKYVNDGFASMRKAIKGMQA
jgi:hypothetical protein